ncbi:FTR1 family iron permease [Photobacterium sanguinicancri]|uniref:FTR1 family iron permease n=1 Tax=Photobacterium sanguinicancri TaxID=875932 RepID=UPI0026E47F07|nr:FTR1 family protein [Photobacterium sanguinicancri]MDO6497512.1 FTR1 family protein [Photobacterium sanguinicancri]
MLASFLITLREGLEAFLLVGIALSYLAKLNARQYNKYIYLGVFVGLLLSLAVAVVFQVVVDQFSNELYRNYLMAGILTFATVVLTYMAIWMQNQAKNQVAQMQQDVSDMVSSGNLFGLVFLSLLAVLREGFETILFFSALMYSNFGEFSTQDALIGAVAGLLLSLAIVWLMLRTTRNVPLRSFFRWTSLLIIVIAAGLLSSAVNMLQAAHVLPVLHAQLFDISHILDDRGVFGTFLRALFGYNSSPGLLQLAVWGGYMVTFIFFWNRGYKQA